MFSIRNHQCQSIGTVTVPFMLNSVIQEN